jgi:phosphoribosylformylglycinamidine cyclo-ligase
MVHCGGAQTKILHFREFTHYKDNLFPPPLFQLIQSNQNRLEEMYQVFNCGHRMELYVPEAVADIIAFQIL